MPRRDGNIAERGRSALAATLVSCALGLAVGAAAPPSAEAAEWRVAQLPFQGPTGLLYGAACPSESLCVVVGTNSTVGVSREPRGGSSSWSVANVEGLWLPPMPGPTSFPGNALTGVSCPTVSFCAISGPQGHLFTSTDPGGGLAAWQLADLGLEAAHMQGISCPTPSFCVAVAYNGKVITSTDPSGGAAEWSVAQIRPGLDLRGVSCPTPSFCAAVSNGGEIVVSTDPAGGAAAWRSAGSPAGEVSLNGIDCPTTSFCITGSAGKFVLSTEAADPASWRAVAAGTGIPVKGLSCPLPSACAAIDNNADVMTSTNPTGGAADWSFVNVIPYTWSGPDGQPNGTFAIDCPSTGLCVGVGNDFTVISSGDPFAAEPSWSGRAGGKGRSRLRVRLTAHPAKRVSPRRGGRRVAFRFEANAAGARFRCRLNRELKGRERSFDRRRYRPCKPPRRYRLGAGEYRFRVYARDGRGRRSAPATFHFRVGEVLEKGPNHTCEQGPGGSGAAGRLASSSAAPAPPPAPAPAPGFNPCITPR